MMRAPERDAGNRQSHPDYERHVLNEALTPCLLLRRAPNDASRVLIDAEVIVSVQSLRGGSVVHVAALVAARFARGKEVIVAVVRESGVSAWALDRRRSLK